MNTKQSDQNKAEEEAARAAAQALDETFGAGTAWTLAGDTDKAVAHTEMHVGDVVGDPALVARGVADEVYGAAEHVEGRMEHDYAAEQAQIESDIAALKAEAAKLRAEFAQARGDTKTKAQAQMNAAKARQQGIETRIKT